MKKIIVVVVVVVALGLVATILLTRQAGFSTPTTEVVNQVPIGDPMDATMEFYGPWLAAELSTSSDPQTENLLAHPRLTSELSTGLTSALEDTTLEVNPVLCQTSIPPRIGTKLSYRLDTKAEVHVLARGLEDRSTRIAVVTLTAQNGEWVISDITCSNGETAPEREFSFDKEGFLLKNVPPPLNADNWHLVFEENGVMGHTAPLFFSPESTCIATDTTSTVCSPDTFTEPSKALVQGEMAEAGVSVQRVTFLE